MTTPRRCIAVDCRQPARPWPMPPVCDKHARPAPYWRDDPEGPYQQRIAAARAVIEQFGGRYELERAVVWSMPSGGGRQDADKLEAVADRLLRGYTPPVNAYLRTSTDLLVEAYVRGRGRLVSQ